MGRQTDAVVIDRDVVPQRIIAKLATPPTKTEALKGTMVKGYATSRGNLITRRADRTLVTENIACIPHASRHNYPHQE